MPGGAAGEPPHPRRPPPPVAVRDEAGQGLRAFTEKEYQAFLDFYPIMRADFSLSSEVWLGPPRTWILPGFHRRFDWVLEHSDWAHRDTETYLLVKRSGIVPMTPEQHRREDPSFVFLSPFAIRRLLRSAARSFSLAPGRARRRAVVFAGSDQLLSDSFGPNRAARDAVSRELRKYFGAVFYEAKDVKVEGVRSMPIGLSEHYLRQPGSAEAASVAIASAALGSKRRAALLAAGGFSDFSDAEGAAAEAFGDLRARATENRHKGRAWALTTQAKQAGVEVRSIARGLWWSELAQYRFLLSPWGDGVQSPKAIEALLVLTIPIVMRGNFPVFDDLVAMGFPIVVIDDWSNITSSRLDQWWEALSPRLARFRATCLNATGYWRLVTGRTRRCGE